MINLTKVEMTVVEYLAKQELRRIERKKNKHITDEMIVEEIKQ